MEEILETVEDWKTIVGGKCGVIIDAMTYRTAEMFVLGAKGAVEESRIGDDEAIWNAISQNIGALQTFIDTLILNKRLPMIAYWKTFGHPDYPATSASIKLLNYCNHNEEVLLAVGLNEGAYFPLKEAAIKTMNHERPILTNEMRLLVLPELSAFDYNWHPNLDDIEGFRDASDDDKTLLTFLFGRVIFDAYAQAAEADEVFQPKLAKLHILSSLRRSEDRERLQASVFSGLREIARGGKENITDLINVTWVPTFLPYLLSKDPQSPNDLLEKAIELRKDPAVQDYTAWFHELKKDLDYNREPPAASMRELERIRRTILEQIKISNEDPVTVKLHIAPVKPSAAIEHEVHLSRIWGWVTSLFPGNRYRKLLMEMVDAERRYRKLDTQLKALWRSTSA